MNFYNTFFSRIKISKNSSAKCYQKNKERLQKKAFERYQGPLKNRKTKNHRMVGNGIKISQNMKNKS